MPATAPYQIYPCGDHAVTIELGDTIDPLINQKVISLFQYLQANPITGVRDIIPAYHTVTIVYDLSVLQKTSSLSVYEMMRTHLQKAAERSSDAEKKSSRQISIPVCYDLSLAPDIASLAETHGLSIEEVIAIHTAKTYRVYMIGFLPGFAYMGTVDDTINTHRAKQYQELMYRREA
jgi:inhibitor of KinA